MPKPEESIVVRLVGPRDGPWDVLAPAVGLWTAPSTEATLVAAGGVVGALRRLNRTVLLVLPPGHGGRIEGAPRSAVVAVGYGDVLFRLVALGDGGADAAGPVVSDPHEPSDVPAGCAALRAPTDGIFYHRPDPTSAPFVGVGDRVRSGQPVGLVEVMKTFNQILYGGPGLPAEAVVVEIRRGEGQEIVAGDVLVVVRSVSDPPPS